jgi:EAL and modified HD-GYP domain-containing signal transduction protein
VETIISAGAADLVRRTRVARQAIYDAQRKIVSYQLMFGPGDGVRDGARDIAGDQATSQLIATTFGTFGIDTISAGRPVFINFTRAFVAGVIPIPVEPAQVVVQIGPSMMVDHELLLGLRALQAAGYRVAFGDYRGEPVHQPLVDLADFVGIEAGDLTPATLAALADQARSGRATLLATGVTDATVMQRCAALGFELFQGTYLQRPSVLEGRTLSPIQLVCVRLLNQLGDPDAAIGKIEQVVGSDPGLSMRLLRTANSAASGARQEITSLHQSIVLLGPRRLRAWVVLTLLEGGTTRNLTDDLWSVLARAYACQRLTSRESDLAYTVGLLSGCADLLGAGPAEVAEGAGVGEQTRSALVEGAGEAGRTLTAVLAHERDDPDAIATTGLIPFDVSRAYLEALSESLTVVHALSG